jgi:hypothetical protein
LIVFEILKSEPAGIRTQDPYIKSVMLYQLSYGFIKFEKIKNVSLIASAKVAGISLKPKNDP